MLKRKTILERKKYNSKIIETAVEIVCQIKGYSANPDGSTKQLIEPRPSHHEH